MKELDLLKKHWNENQSFPKVSTQEIHKMIHKKSSSIVLWILGISIAEFVLLNILSFFFTSKPINEGLGDAPIFTFVMNNIDYLSGLISILFIVLFYRNYKKIYVASSTSMLMKQILKTKQSVNYYIYTNIVVFIMAFILIVINFIYHNLDKEVTMRMHLIAFGSLLLVCAAFLGFVWLYYKLVYGFLIKKLMRNYKELEKIDYE